MGLRLEGRLVLGDLTLVVSTGVHHTGDGTEAGALSNLVGRRSGLADYFLAQVQFVAVRTGRGRYAVRTQQHFLTVVLTLTGF